MALLYPCHCLRLLDINEPQARSTLNKKNVRVPIAAHAIVLEVEILHGMLHADGANIRPSEGRENWSDGCSFVGAIVEYMGCSHIAAWLRF